MRIQVIKKKASSHKELGREMIEIEAASTLRDLLVAVFEHERQTLDAPAADTLSQAEIEQRSSLGKVAFGLYQPKQNAAKEAMHTLLRDFEDGLYRVFINAHEVTRLDEAIHLRDDDEIVFLRLVMLAGRLW